MAPIDKRGPACRDDRWSWVRGHRAFHHELAAGRFRGALSGSLLQSCSLYRSLDDDRADSVIVSMPDRAQNVEL
jgi:hypothetical protein